MQGVLVQDREAALLVVLVLPSSRGPDRVREDLGVAILGNFGPDQVVRADELNLLELMLKLLRTEGGVELDSELGAVAVELHCLTRLPWPRL